MNVESATAIHCGLDSGIELAVAPMPQRRVVALEFRFLVGVTHEPADKLGLLRLVRDTIDKGTDQRNGQALWNAFDELGMATRSWSGREACGFSCLWLPEYVDRAIELHAEFLRTPTFPESVVEATLKLTEQEFAALEDEPAALIDKLIERQTFGPILGRHSLGERDTVAGLGRSDLVAFWQQMFGAGRMQVLAAGSVDGDALSKTLDQCFAGFGDPSKAGRESVAFEFAPACRHHHKDLEQEHIAIAFPSARVTDDDYPTERLLLGVLSGGMSARLFTEVREKQGLAYSVSAHSANPRGSGVILLTAGCIPDRAQATYRTLLREIDRLSKDLTQQELDRARQRILAREETMADLTRSRRNMLGFDLFHFGQPVPLETKLDMIKAVTLDHLTDYLRRHRRDQLSVVTLGPVELEVDK